MIWWPKIHVIYLDGEGHTRLLQGIIRALGILIAEENILHTFIRINVSFWERQPSELIVNTEARDRSEAVISLLDVFLHQLVCQLQG